MNNTFIFIFLFFFFFIFTKVFFKKAVNFMISLKFSDGIQYFLYVAFTIGCILLIFQKVNLPYVAENPILFKCILAIPLLGLCTLMPVLDFVKNPQHPTRLQILQTLADKEELKKALEESKKILEETNAWKVKYLDILNRCNEEMDKINASDLSDAEKQEKANEIMDKYNKEIELLSSNKN